MRHWSRLALIGLLGSLGACAGGTETAQSPATTPGASSAQPTSSPSPTPTKRPTPSPKPESPYTIPGAEEQELPATDLTQDEIAALFLRGSGLGISVDEFVAAWNGDDEIQTELMITDVALEEVGPSGFAITQHQLTDTSIVMLLTDADESLRAATLLTEPGATGDPIDDGFAGLQHAFVTGYFVSAVNPRLDQFERNNLTADMIELDEIMAEGGVAASTDLYLSPLREMIIVKGVRYDLARDEDGLVYLIATGE